MVYVEFYFYIFSAHIIRHFAPCLFQEPDRKVPLIDDIDTKVNFFSTTFCIKCGNHIASNNSFLNNDNMWL